MAELYIRLECNSTSGMGFFVMGSAAVLALLQATLLILHRKQTSWTFTLVRKENAPEVQALDMAACSAARNGSEDLCLLWYHTAQSIEPVLNEFNPHLIVLCIACVHCIVTMYGGSKDGAMTSRTKTAALPAGRFFSREYAAGALSAFLASSRYQVTYNMYEVAGALFLLWVTIAFIVGFAQKEEEEHGEWRTLESSTWLTCLFLFAATGLFVYMQNHVSSDREQDAGNMAWNMVFELQVVGVPLTVLMLAAMGVRSYPEVVIHFLLLSAAVNSLWLQAILEGSALYVCKLLTVAIPSISVYLTHMQLPGKQHIVTGMAAVSLIPLFVMPVILTQTDTREVDKFQLRLSALCSSAGLFASIIHLAQL